MTILERRLLMAALERETAKRKFRDAVEAAYGPDAGGDRREAQKAAVFAQKRWDDARDRFEDLSAAHWEANAEAVA